MADDPVRLSREQRLQTLQNRHALRQMTRAGLPPIDDDVDIPTPAERIARLAARVGTQRPDVLPPRAPIRGEAEPAPPPELTPVSEGEAQLNDVTDRLRHEAARRGLVRLLAAPGAAQTATTVERILGANLPGAAGEHFSNIAGQHEEEERLARDEHPVAGAASDVGALYLQMEALGRIPGPIGQIFREPAVGGTPATRGLFEGGKITGTLETEGVGTVRDRLARAAMVEGRRFAALEGGTSLAERDPADVVAERAGLGFAGGAGFGVAGQGARELTSTAVRAGLRGIARRNLPPMESPFLEPAQLESGAPRALLAPPAEPIGQAGMPPHVANAGAAQRLALELTGQSPDPLPGQPVAASSQGQSVAPIGAAPSREIPLEPPPSIVPKTPYEPPRPKPIVLPEGAPEVLGGEAGDVGRHAAKPGDVGTLPQPRRKNFKTYDDDALEARWVEISDRMEAMARQRDAGTTPWVRKEERSSGAGSSGGRGFGGYSREKGVLSGTAINASAGRALGRMKDDTRILGELEREFHARGINPADVMDRYIERGHRLQAEQESEAERAALENQDEGGGDTSFDVREPRRGPYDVAPSSISAFWPEGRERVLRGETVPAVRRPDGQVFVAPYHVKAWEMAYPDVKIFEGEELPSDAQEGFMMRGKFHVRSIEKRGRDVRERQPQLYGGRAAQLDRLYGTDQALGVTKASDDEPARLPGGGEASRCTDCARHIVEREGRGRVVGYAEGSNPTAEASGSAPGDGHDFAVIDERYIVDPWVRETSGASHQAVFDLQHAGDRAEVQRLYGDPRKWEELDGYRKGDLPKGIAHIVEQASKPAESVREPRGGYGKKAPRLELEKGRPRDIGEALIAEFGETDVPGHAGFLLSDGRLVNLSGSAGQRGDDHRIVETLFDYKGHDSQAGVPGYSRWDAVQRVMDDGIARIHFASPDVLRRVGSGHAGSGIAMIDISRPLTDAQRRVIRRVMAEYSRHASVDLAVDLTVDGTVVNSVYVPDAHPSDLDRVVDQDFYDKAEKKRGGKKKPPSIREEPQAYGVPAVREGGTLRAYHGSPYRFDRFSDAAIGTGQGAASYGHGHYFADLEEIGEGYRKQLALGKDHNASISIDGKPLYRGNPMVGSHYIGDLGLSEEEQRGALEVHYEVQWIPKEKSAEALSIARKRIQDYVDAVPENIGLYEQRIAETRAEGREPAQLESDLRKIRQTLEAKRAALKLLDEHKVEYLPPERAGATYTVELKADHDEMLDWDLPLTKQSAYVQNRLRNELHYELDRAKIKYPTLKQALHLFASVRVQRLAASDIGIRESLRNGLIYAEQGDEDLFRRWFDHHGRLLSPGRVPALHRNGEDFYESLVSEMGIEEFNGRRDAMKRASAKLLRAGIKGIRYLDQGSRGKSRARRPYTGSTELLAAATDLKQNNYQFEDADDALTKAYPFASQPARIAALEEAYDVKPKLTYNYVVFSDRDIAITAVREMLKPSPWLDKQGKVSEADAAFGGEQQMELSLDKAVEQLQLKPEKPETPAARPKRAKGEPVVKAVAHYKKRAAAARKIVADLKKGQADWTGRQFPNVWPEASYIEPQLKVWQTTGKLGIPSPKYQEFLDGIGTMLQALRSPFVETLVMFGTREGKVVLSHVVTSGILGAASVEAKGGVDLSALFLEDALRAGATHVHTAHNHPSGRTDPSGLDGDIGMWGSLVSRADRMGLKPGINLIIDDETFSVSEFRKEQDGSGYSVEPKFMPYRYSPKVPWFAPAPGFEDRIVAPEDVAAIVHKLGKTKNGYLIHLNNSSAIVGIEPFTPGDNVKPAVASAAKRYGASGTIVGINDRAMFVDFLDTYKTSSTLIRGVLDIIGAFSGEMQYVSARLSGEIKVNESIRLERQWLATITGRRIHEPGPMADPWRGQPGYVTDPAVLGARPIIVPRGLVADGPRAVREGLGPAYGEDNLPNTASIIAQEAIDAAEKLGIAPAAEGTVEKLVTAFAGTRLEQIGGPLHLVLVEYERQRVELEQAVHKDIIKESLNRSAVEFMARLPYFNEFRAVSLLAWLRDKLPKAIGKSIGVTPDRQEALFNAAEAIAEFGPDEEPVFRDVLERTGQLDETGYQRLVEIYGHPAKLELEVEQLKKALETIRHDLVRPSVTLSPANYAVERYKLSQRAKQEAKKGQAAQILSALKSERNAKKQELTELKGQRDLHAKEGILDDDAAAALPAEIERTAKELDSLRAQISRFEGLVAGRTPAGPAIDPKELPAKLKELDAKLAKWRELRGKAKETDEVLRARWSNLRAFREAYEARSQGRQAGEVRITADEAKRRWDALSPAEQGVVRRFALDAARAKEKGLLGHVNRELAKLEYEISSDIEAYVHHYGFEDEGAMTLWFGSTLRRKKMIAGARQHRGGVEGFKRHLEGARLHGGLPLSLQKLQNEFAEALERVMFTAPDPNLVRPLGADEDPPEGYSRVLGRFGEFKGQAYAVANPIYKELEFFGTRPPVHPTTDAQANRAWELTKKGVSRAIYYWALNQLVSVGTAVRNFYGGAIQYATLVAEDLAAGKLVDATQHLLALAKALSPANAREFPSTEFGASQQTLRELDQAHGLFRAFMNVALLPFGMVENFFKRALTIGTRELEARRIAREILYEQAFPTKTKPGRLVTEDEVDKLATQLFDAPTFEMRASEELVRDAFAYNYNNIPLALKKMNKSAIGKALIPFPIYGYKFSRHVGRYTGAISRLARMKGRAGDLQKAIAAIIIFGLPAVLTWLGDDEGKAKTTDPGSGIKYDFDRSGRVYVGLNDEGRELWMRTNSYSFYGLGATIGHVAHDRSLIEAKNYLADFYSVGPGFQAADYLRQVRNRYQAYRNNASIAGDFARSWIPFHRPLETATRMVDPIRRKQESFTESMLYAVPIPEPVLNQFGLSRGEPRTAMGGAQLVPGYNPLLEFLKEFGGVNLKPIDPRQAQDEYRRAAIRTQARERRSHAETQRLRRLEQRQRERQ